MTTVPKWSAMRESPSGAVGTAIVLEVAWCSQGGAFVPLLRSDTEIGSICCDANKRAHTNEHCSFRAGLGSVNGKIGNVSYTPHDTSGKSSGLALDLFHTRNTDSLGTSYCVIVKLVPQRTQVKSMRAIPQPAVGDHELEGAAA